MIDGLPPPLAKIVRAQLASGRFHSDTEVVGAALRLLEEQAQTHQVAFAWLKQEIDKGLNSKPAQPVTKAFWDHLRARLHAGPAHGE